MEKEPDELTIPAQTSPGIKRSAPAAASSGCAGEKWATETTRRKKWTQKENLEVMRCYFLSEPKKRGYRKRMHSIWQQRNPSAPVSEQRLADQRHVINRAGTFTPVEIENIQRQLTCQEEQQLHHHQEPRQNTPIVEEPLEAQSEGIPPEGTLAREIIDEMAAMRMVEVRAPVRILKRSDPQLYQLVKEANIAVQSIPTKNITETNLLMYSTAKTIARRIQGGERAKKPTKPQTPPWRRRLENKIAQTRKDISKLDAAKRGRTKLTDDLKQKYWLEQRGFNHAIEDAKQRLTALAHRLKRYNARNEQFRVNKMFKEQPGRVYQNLRGNGSNESPPVPDKGETEQFWRKIWGEQKHHRTGAEWIKDFNANHEAVSPQPPVNITEEVVRAKVKKMSNWKSPGPDQVQGFWLKKMTGLHERMATQLQQIIDDPTNLPKWLTNGRTTLIQKDPTKGNAPSNYRPITCLPTTWKLLSGILADGVMAHLSQQNILAEEQKGIKPGSRGTKDQLFIDKAVCKDSRTRRTNLAVAWIDYQKAYDSVPHSWIIEAMRMHKIDDKICTLIEESMPNWVTDLTASGEHLARIPVRCGIFQGDALSPLLFCVAINPLSHILRNSRRGYTLRSGHIIHHLLYMDDLKLYGKNEREIDSMINTVRIFSDDIGMKFGLEKCGRLIIKRGKVVVTQGLLLDIGKIRDVEVEKGYKYLGILQGMENLQKQVKANTVKTYTKRIRQVMKTKLNGQNKIQAINTYAMPVVSYTAGIIEWTQTEMKDLDRKTRKLLNMYGGLHPRADVHRLYLPRHQGGRGLKEVEATVTGESMGLDEYIQRMKEKEPLLQATWQTKQQEAVKKDEWKAGWSRRYKSKWREKPLHGQYPQQVEEVTTTEMAYKWLSCTGLKIETEALITAAQDQALNTKSHQTNIMKVTTDSKCRMCTDTDETVSHLVAGCQKLAATEYLERHNKVAAALHLEICRHYGIPTAEQQPWLHRPETVNETERVKILWDFEVRTDRAITARRPDIIVVDKQEKTAKIIDVAIPLDKNIRGKESEKIQKYQDLKLELQKLWNVKAEVIPVVIGALGAVSTSLEGHLQRTPGEHDMRKLMKQAILGSAHILRKVLDLPGSG